MVTSAPSGESPLAPPLVCSLLVLGLRFPLFEGGGAGLLLVEFEAGALGSSADKSTGVLVLSNVILDTVDLSFESLSGLLDFG